MTEPRRNTLRAVDEYDGTAIFFDDFVYDGDTVEVTGRGARVAYYERGDDVSEWWLRPLTETEREARIKSVMSRV